MRKSSELMFVKFFEKLNKILSEQKSNPIIEIRKNK